MFRAILTPRRRLAAGVLFAVAGAVVVGCEQDVSLPTPTPPTAAKTTVPTSDEALRDRVDRAIRITADRVLDKDVNNAWQVVHGILAYGPDLQMRVDGRNVSALRWLFDGNQMNGWVLFPGPKGLDAQLEPGSSSAQGHPDQWIGYLACCNVKLDEPIIVTVNGERRTYKFQDMLEQAKWKIYDGMEATWTLMAFAHYSNKDYLPIFGQWTASDGKTWTMEQIVDMEAEAGIEGAACGGAHRLFALASAVQLFKKTGLPLSGGWKKADDLLRDSIAKAFEFQQPDGGFSNDRFVRSSISADADERIDSTGHVLEVLAHALSDEELRDPRMTRAVNFLCKKIEDTQSIPVGCGGLYHGASGLMIYRERRFGKPSLTTAAK